MTGQRSSSLVKTNASPLARLKDCSANPHSRSRQDLSGLSRDSAINQVLQNEQTSPVEAHSSSSDAWHLPMANRAKGRANSVVMMLIAGVAQKEIAQND